MKVLIGLVLAGLSALIGWWAFNKAASGQDSFNWVWVIALGALVFAVLLIFAQVSRWMKS